MFRSYISNQIRCQPQEIILVHTSFCWKRRCFMLCSNFNIKYSTFTISAALSASWRAARTAPLFSALSCSWDSNYSHQIPLLCRKKSPTRSTYSCTTICSNTRNFRVTKSRKNSLLLRATRNFRVSKFSNLFHPDVSLPASLSDSRGLGIFEFHCT